MVPTLSAIRGHLGNSDIYDFIPLIVWGATNTASGLYEWYRYEKNKLTEKAKTSLETRVQESLPFPTAQAQQPLIENKQRIEEIINNPTNQAYQPKKLTQ